MDSVASSRDRALAILQRHGREPISFQTLARGLHYLFEGEGEDEGFVAYADTGRAWVAAGPPVGAPARRKQLIRRYGEQARRQGRRPRWFGVRADFGQDEGLARMGIGEEPVWDPAGWQSTLAGSRSLREQLRRARAKGVRVRELSPDELREDGALRASLERVAGRWWASRRMAPMGFLLNLDPFRLIEERIYVVAERDGDVLELLVASPVHGRGGWLVEHLLRDPSAPNGTTELLIDRFMRLLDERGCRYVSLGLAPLAGRVRSGLRAARRAGRVLYNFDGLYAFKAKLRPLRWEPMYLAYPREERGVRAVVDVLAAFATDGFGRFAFACIRHLWRPIAGVLALLLVPWTVLLAFASSAWFPSAGVKWTWVGLDVVLVALMSTLLWVGRRIDPTQPYGHVREVPRRLQRWRGLLSVLFVLTGLDAVLTMVQALAFNIPRATSLLDGSLIAVSILAPTMAAVFFGVLRSGSGPAAPPVGSPEHSEVQR